MVSLVGILALVAAASAAPYNYNYNQGYNYVDLDDTFVVHSKPAVNFHSAAFETPSHHGYWSHPGMFSTANVYLKPGYGSPFSPTVFLVAIPESDSVKSAADEAIVRVPSVSLLPPTKNWASSSQLSGYQHSVDFVALAKSAAEEAEAELSLGLGFSNAGVPTSLDEFAAGNESKEKPGFEEPVDSDSSKSSEKPDEVVPVKASEETVVFGANSEEKTESDSGIKTASSTESKKEEGGDSGESLLRDSKTDETVAENDEIPTEPIGDQFTKVAMEMGSPKPEEEKEDRMNEKEAPVVEDTGAKIDIGSLLPGLAKDPGMSGEVVDTGVKSSEKTDESPISVNVESGPGLSSTDGATVLDSSAKPSGSDASKLVEDDEAELASTTSSVIGAAVNEDSGVKSLDSEEHSTLLTEGAIAVDKLQSDETTADREEKFDLGDVSIDGEEKEEN